MEEKPKSRGLRLKTKAELGGIIAILGFVGALLGVFEPILNMVQDRSPSKPVGQPSSTIESPRPGSTASTLPDEKTVREKLLSAVEDETIKNTCFASKKLVQKALMSMECFATKDTVGLSISLFEDKANMYDVYNRIAKEAGVPRDSGYENCTRNKSGESAWEYEADSDEIDDGRLLCYVDKSQHAWLHWTYDANNVYAYARREDSNIGELFKVWETF